MLISGGLNGDYNPNIAKLMLSSNHGMSDRGVVTTEDEDGKILPLEKAKDKVVAELNAKATKDLALRAYIAYKKAKLSDEITIEKTLISSSNN